MFDKVAVVGDADLVLAFRALGIKVFSPRNVEEARQALETVQRENYGLCFVHESLLEHLKPEREALAPRFCPVVVGFSDYRKITDRLQQMMRELAIKATGSDSLVRRRGEDETQ